MSALASNFMWTPHIFHIVIIILCQPGTHSHNKCVDHYKMLAQKPYIIFNPQPSFEKT